MSKSIQYITLDQFDGQSIREIESSIHAFRSSAIRNGQLLVLVADENRLESRYQEIRDCSGDYNLDPRHIPHSSLFMRLCDSVIVTRDSHVTILRNPYPGITSTLYAYKRDI